MAPSSLHGLNVVHPPHTSSGAQDLLPGPSFHDSELYWKNINFDDEEPLFDEKRPSTDSLHDSHGEDNHSIESGLPQAHAQGMNVPNLLPQNTYDLAELLASYGRVAQNNQPSLSIVQMLAAAQGPNFALPQQPAEPSSGKSAAYDTPPAAKRSRTRKSSISSSPEVQSPEDSVESSLSVAEDKRRRNTAASARFRLKKKEREAALETRAKELESRVGELERECEGLRRENGWLKGLVVGVTSGVPAAGPAQLGIKRVREEEDA
ncbi:unnamed protein product [Mycena citricolor]|uniref:BZIP domain-containing protein n=1 Tax=Mycena citricolor TaxID=2018698 RepID=A0AAD2HQS3_9AGAR|nr:unnamed protein product [Mycena citricolor]CAK5279380.1 unnamed protein product [Mycena citricolor]